VKCKQIELRNHPRRVMVEAREGGTAMLAGSSLTRSVGEAHEQALVALTDPGGRPADAIAWLSAHLAAAEHVLYPEFGRVRPGGHATLDLRRGTHRLLLRLRAFEQACAGGPVPPGTSMAAVRDDLVDALVEHVAAEHVLIGELLAQLSEEGAMLLAARYEAAFCQGPTRPHPHGAHRGPLEPVTFAFDVVRDRVLDVLDARAVPVPRAPRRPARRLGRWGRYLLGASVDSETTAPGGEVESS
jgi:hypothetical protein